MWGTLNLRALGVPGGGFRVSYTPDLGLQVPFFQLKGTLLIYKVKLERVAHESQRLAFGFWFAASHLGSAGHWSLGPRTD